MRILFLSDNFPPEVNAPASRTFEHCREWVKAGHQVTVITCNPNFPQGKLFAGHTNRLMPRRDTVEGIEVVRVWSYITANEGFAKRVLDYLSFAFTAFLAGLRERPDVIVATSPQFFTTLAGAALSMVKNRPWIFEVRDLWPESIAAVGAMKTGALLRWLEKLELALYRHADRVVVVTDAFKRNLAGRGIDPAKIGVVTNGVLLDSLLVAAERGLTAYAWHSDLAKPAAQRLAFRELGLAIGLGALDGMLKNMWSVLEDRAHGPTLRARLNALAPRRVLGTALEAFWLEPRHRRTVSWAQHQDINDVMLAASLLPDACSLP